MESEAMRAAKVALQVVCVFTFVGNLLVVVVFAATERLRIKYYGFVFNLVITDIATAVMAFVYQINPGPIVTCLVRMCFLAAVLNILSVAVSRLISLSVMPPARYEALMTWRRIVAACLLMWVATALIYIPMAFYEVLLVTALVNSVIILAALFITGIVYFVVFRKITRYRAPLASSPGVSREGEASSVRVRQTRHLMVTFTVILATSLVCWTPFCICNFIIYSSWWVSRTPGFMLIYKCIHIVLLMNSALDPFIYWWRIREIREGLYRLVCLGRNQQAECHDQADSTNIETVVE